MKKRIRLLTIVLCSLLCFGSTTFISNASSDQPAGFETETKVVKIITKYRTNNGKVQYRRWNVSVGVWVDDHWIDL